MQKFPLWRADSYVGSTGYVWTEAVSGIARSRLSDRGEGAKEWGDANVKGARKAGQGGKTGSSFLLFFRVRASSISRTRLSRSLEQAISRKATVRIQKYPDTFDGASGS